MDVLYTIGTDGCDHVVLRNATGEILNYVDANDTVGVAEVARRVGTMVSTHVATDWAPNG